MFNINTLYNETTSECSDRGVLSRAAPPAGKKNKLRVYYLSWLRNKILHNDPEVEKKQGWVNVGDLEGCVHYKVGRCHYPLHLRRSLT